MDYKYLVLYLEYFYQNKFNTKVVKLIPMQFAWKVR
jgi:hypothetical protein